MDYGHCKQEGEMDATFKRRDAISWDKASHLGTEGLSRGRDNFNRWDPGITTNLVMNYVGKDTNKRRT